jgi:hypothetical protein
MAKNMFPERISSTVSKLNVEKVLNPPQMPTMIKDLVPALHSAFWLKK